VEEDGIMGNQPGADDRLFTTRWVHLFEEDTPRGEVYVPEDGPIPLSRRPRTRLELKPDGSATMFVSGPDDRPAPHASRWTEENDEGIMRSGSGGVALRILERSAARLVVAKTQTGS
jgi:hypothetical protein